MHYCTMENKEIELELENILHLLTHYKRRDFGKFVRHCLLYQRGQAVKYRNVIT